MSNTASPVVTRIMQETDDPFIDVMHGAKRVEMAVLDHGFVALTDCSPRLVLKSRGTADYAVAQNARVSYGQDIKTPEEDHGLIRYLIRHRHTTPFERVSFVFNMAMPIFVARQFIRHRTFKTNEISARYAVLPDKFYIPDAANIRAQSKSNKQGRGAELPAEACEALRAWLQDSSREAYAAYEDQIEDGVARELARLGLPLNVYTEWYWTCDLHNLFHFLGLRCEKHAQWEAQQYANAMLSLIEPIVPVCVQAWRDYRFDAVTLSALEVKAMRDILGLMREKLGASEFDAASGQALDTMMWSTEDPAHPMGKREVVEWSEKYAKLMPATGV